MSTPARGRADYWKPGDWNALCYQCGRKRKAGDLMRYWQGYWLCPEHWESRQPQDFVRGVPDIQAAPWVQPPGLDGIPQLFVDIGDSDDTYTLTVSTATIAAVNDTLVIITIMEGVYIGILDLTGLPAGWTVQLNNFGGVGVIIGTATVRAGPPGKDLPPQIDLSLATVAAAPQQVAVLPAVSTITVQLYNTDATPAGAGIPVSLESTPFGTIVSTPTYTNGSGQATFTFGATDKGIYTLVASVATRDIAQQPEVTVGGFILTSAHFSDPNAEAYGFSLLVSFGAISPSALNGALITGFASSVNIPPDPIDGFDVIMAGSLAQNFWTSVTVNGSTFFSASATFFHVGGFTLWAFPGSFPFFTTGDFQVDFT